MQLIDQERLIEQSKINLVHHIDFNIFDCFRVFDNMGRGSITQQELFHGLMQSFGIVPSQDEIDLFFQRYDKDHDGRLRFPEFAEIFVPLDINFSQVINSRQPMHRSDLYGPAGP